jgi:hypothetical protein
MTLLRFTADYDHGGQARSTANNQIREGLTIINTQDFTLTITVPNRASLERQLDAAVALAQSKAMGHPAKGILVTRHDYDCFTVALSDAVPFGLIREKHDWRTSEMVDTALSPVHES